MEFKEFAWNFRNTRAEFKACAWNLRKLRGIQELCVGFKEYTRGI